MTVGLYFGTFNPIHIGHLIIANHFVNHPDLDQVWMVVTPQNPLKDKNTLLADYHRMAMVRVAVEDNPKLRASDIEFKLEKPSYTVNTLAHLQERYPEHTFALIMGEDNLRSLHKWKNFEVLLNQHKIYVYPRLEEEPKPEKGKKAKKPRATHVLEHPNTTILDDCPVMKISASFIRASVKAGKDVRYLLSEPVYKYLTEMHFYKK